MPFKACLMLLFNNILILLNALTLADAETITLAVEYNVPVKQGFCVGSILNVWPPDSDPIVYELGDDMEISLELEGVGIYFFTAQWVIYHEESGSIARYTNGKEAISEESERIEYEVVPDVEQIDPGDTIENDVHGDEPDMQDASEISEITEQTVGCFLTAIECFKSRD